MFIRFRIRTQRVNHDIDHVVISDSVPVGRLQRASTQRIFALGSKSQGATATGNIYCKSQIYKKNDFFPEDTTYTQPESVRI